MVCIPVSRKFSIPLAVLALGLCMLEGASGFIPSSYWGGYDRPGCGEGETFFSDFMKCDASLHYCFEYKNDSCVGPDNWVCVHNLNRKAGLDSAETDVYEKNEGYGNTRCCGGQRQSPINIPAYDAQCIHLPTPYFLNPWLKLTGTFENSGYYSKFFVEAENYKEPLVLSGVPYTCSMYNDDKYIFGNIHIHTGIKGKHGSAHFVDGKTYDGEFHIVHVHSTFYEPGKIDMRCASQSPLGLAVIGVFLSLTEGFPNPELDKLLTEENLDKIEKNSRGM